MFAPDIVPINTPIGGLREYAASDPGGWTTEVRVGESPREVPPSWPMPPHMVDVFASGKYSDAKIQLSSANESDPFPTTILDVHRVVVSQSPVVGAILERESMPQTTVHIIAGESFSAPRGFELALQHLYGLELLGLGNVYNFAHQILGVEVVDGYTPDKLKKTAMDLALAYGATGAFLNQPDVVDAAFKLVVGLFDWSNLETALQFGLFPEEFLLAWIPLKNIAKEDTNSSSSSSSNNKDSKGKRKKRRSIRGKRAHKKTVVIDNLNTELVEKYAPRVASATIDFLVQNLPSNFFFDRAALANDLHDRIPVHLRSMYSLSNMNPLLATLQFGDFPIPTPECTHASAIFLALPFAHLREATEKMRNSGILTKDIIKAILQEREERRLTALEKHAEYTYNKGDDIDSMVNELGYHEFAVHLEGFEVSSGVGVTQYEYSLNREWQGLWPEGDGF
ncbi:conserved hypothetical protein [Talaromyces stipitatus ATCC 10500]|uniref:BTB domain-containing protein n=1 Tax=Talaromyces stipitatus (strain ATCC 10500 / CBS 375.48 / QM 6759 / NRRL 1006) TaxID=441959 RepID=B8M8I8_TALSN|nr:uncharacterized protein TSTA_037210 [Talaromyces stipitatus ATCC 10500]EED20501.1 conserved hypothetical protein [Talaromyces stipitatus ATCC 10500]